MENRFQQSLFEEIIPTRHMYTGTEWLMADEQKGVLNFENRTDRFRYCVERTKSNVNTGKDKVLADI